MATEIGAHLDGDVLAIPLWGGNRRVLGTVSGRQYRTGNYIPTWVDPRDALAQPTLWRLVETPAEVIEPTLDEIASLSAKALDEDYDAVSALVSDALDDDEDEAPRKIEVTRRKRRMAKK